MFKELKSQCLKAIVLVSKRACYTPTGNTVVMSVSNEECTIDANNADLACFNLKGPSLGYFPI